MSPLQHMGPANALEWAEVEAGWLVVASAERAWPHRVLDPQSDPLSMPMGRAGSRPTTKRLLDGAIALARHRPRQGASGLAEPGTKPQSEIDSDSARPRPLTPNMWAWRLCGAYQTTHATPRVMALAAERFASAGYPTLAAWAGDKVREERGHDTLTLRDLAALGYDAERMVAELVPGKAAALVAYFDATLIADDAPLGCVGYAYALERLALLRDRSSVEAVQAILPDGVDATRCMRVHSASGSDAAHVEETIAVVAALEPAARGHIARATYETAQIFYGPPPGGAMSEDRLERVLAPFRRRISHKPITPASTTSG